MSRAGCEINKKKSFHRSHAVYFAINLFSAIIASCHNKKVIFITHIKVYSPCLWYVSPKQSIYHLVMPILNFSSHFPSAWHKFWLSDRVVCVWSAFECVQLVPNYSSPAPGWCRMLLFVHPENNYNSIVYNGQKK